METISPPKPASGELFVQEVGRGNPVALLHGSPTALGFFAPLVDSLKGSCRVLVPEMPGYGRSPAVEYGASFARSQDLLEEALLSRGASEVALVGFSLGAYRALDLALRGRIRVTSNAADLHSRLGMLRIPLLALVGELDAAAPMAYSERLVASVPGARLEVFHGCGHALLVEEPSRATASVRAGLGLG